MENINLQNIVIREIVTRHFLRFTPFIVEFVRENRLNVHGSKTYIISLQRIFWCYFEANTSKCFSFVGQFILSHTNLTVESAFGKILVCTCQYIIEYQ